MSYSLQVFQQEQLTKQNNILIRNCEYCQKEFIVKNKLSKTRFCSMQCVGKSQRKDHVCIGCGITFQNYNTRHLNRSSNPKFCTRKCYHENMSLCINKKSNYRYDKFYYCDHCEKWILQKDSIIFNNWPCCPNLDCGDTRFINSPNRLKISSTISRFNQRRKQVKYIE